MEHFFANVRPGKKVTYGDDVFEMPILYHRDDFFLLYFTADVKKVISIIPSKKLFPVTLPNGKAIVAIAAFNYMETTIGPYGEVPVTIPVIYGKKPFPLTGIVPALMESRYPGFGLLIQHLPVTNELARNAGREVWGYTKFVADMHFSITPEFMECRMWEEDDHILDIRVARKGFYLKDTKPIITYSIKNNSLIKTTIPQKGVKRVSFNTKDSFLKLGSHPMSQSIKELSISDHPFMGAYYSERAAILPAGEQIEANVGQFEGYIGKNREGKHTVEYLGRNVG